MTLRDYALIHYARHSTTTAPKIARVVEAADKEGEWDVLLESSCCVEAHLKGVMDRHGDE